MDNSKDLKKAPLIGDYKDAIEYDVPKTIKNIQQLANNAKTSQLGGINIHSVGNKDFHANGSGLHGYHYITESGEPKGDIVSFIKITAGDDPDLEGGVKGPYTPMAWTHPKHRGKGFKGLLQEHAASYHGGIHSDSSLSPEAHNSWMKLRDKYPDRVRLSPTTPTKDLQGDPDIEGLSTHTDEYDRAADSQHFVAPTLNKAPVSFEADETTPYKNVWRMQHKDNRRGPYVNAYDGEGEKWWDYEHGATTVDPYGAAKADKKHPLPEEDSFNQDDLKVFKEKKPPFAFESAKQLKQWFSNEERQKLFDLGYKPTKVKAKKIWTSGKQAFFDPHESEFDKSELQKGAQGDWQKEGYSFEHSFENPVFYTNTNGEQIKDYTRHKITARNKAGIEAGTYEFDHHHDPEDEHVHPRSSGTNQEDQRKGLANEAYRRIEAITGAKIRRPSRNQQTEDSKALWSQPNRPFGKSELQKGSLQQRFPFKPLQHVQDPKNLDNIDRIFAWQGYGDARSARIHREHIQPMEGNERARALHRLSAKTKVRKAKDGGREFLLHRGDSGARIARILPSLPEGATHETHVAHDSRSSWTPNYLVAKGFSHYNKPDSAWIHEKNIVSIPNQLGNPNAYLPSVTGEKTDLSPDKFPNKFKQGSNPLNNEYEIIVAPHISERADFDPAEYNEMPIKDINERISARAEPLPKKLKGLNTPYDPQSPRAILEHRRKMSKSESLEKALPPEILHQEGYRFKVLPPNKSRDVFLLKAYHKGKPVGHLAYRSYAFSVPENHGESHKNGYHPVINSEVNEAHRGKGLYQHMINLGSQHVKGLGSKGLMSEGYQRSGDATRAWDKVASHAAPDTFLNRPKERNATYFSKSELQKMSRPKIRYPLFGTDPRAEQNVQIIETEKQKKMFGRKAAAMAYPTVEKLKAINPKISEQTLTAILPKKREQTTKEIANRFNRRSTGLNVPGAGRSIQGALAGKARSKYEDFDSDHQDKLKEHNEKRNAIIREYNRKLAAHLEKRPAFYQFQNHEDAMRAMEEWRSGLPQKPVLPRAPSKKALSTTKLTPKQKALRGKTVEGTIEHEAIHGLFDDIKNKHGTVVAKRLLDQTLSNFSPETHSKLNQYLDYVGYKPNTESYKEELLTHARDLLVNPIKRQKFRYLMHTKHSNPIEAEKQYHTFIGNLKKEWQKAYDESKRLKPDDFNKSERQIRYPLEKALKTNEHIKSIAQSYANKKGLTPKFDPNPVKVNPDFASKVARTYESLPHAPNLPQIKNTYQALAQETGDQYKHLVENGFKFSPMQPNQPNPYPTSQHMLNDVYNNKHLWYYPTEQGYGDQQQKISHPLLGDSGLKDSTGRPMLHNDVFRAVHDVLGHALHGNSFGPRGEEKAYRTHRELYSPAAHKALAAETRSQNSFVNFSRKYGEQNRSNPQNTRYADQKAVLVPEWVVQDPA